jgi:hypothetical protein
MNPIPNSDHEKAIDTERPPGPYADHATRAAYIASLVRQARDAGETPINIFMRYGPLNRELGEPLRLPEILWENLPLMSWEEFHRSESRRLGIPDGPPPKPRRRISPLQKRIRREMRRFMRNPVCVEALLDLISKTIAEEVPPLVAHLLEGGD